MKIVFIICAMLIMFTFSCKKSNDQINTPPVVTDTTKSPVVKVDTSTLLKSQIIFANYSGTAFLDSELFQWTYDDQRRVTQKTNAYNSSLNGTTDIYVDTTRFTYLNDRYIQSTIYYKNGSVRATTNIVYYLGLKNRVESISNGPTYFYYNQENQDSLEMYFSNINGLEYSVNYFYTGVNLDSATVRDADGKLNNVGYFSEGNLTSLSYYNNDILTGLTNYTYTNISGRGLDNANLYQIISYFTYRTTNLVSGNSYVTFPPSYTHTSSYTYEQDAAGRVTTIISSTDGIVDQKNVFTYY
jgi:hypothetical protein